MKIIFLGSSDFSVPSLKRIIEDGHEVLAVVCQPDRPNARGNKIEISGVKKLALEKEIPVYQFNKIRTEGVDIIKNLNADLMVVVSYGQILSQELIDLPKLGTINVHGSLLPKYRGASPIASVILNGEEKTGITIMRIAQEVDAGNMLLKEETKILENETCGELSQRLSEIGANLLSKALVELEKGTLVEEVQNHKEATFTKMIKKEDALINFNEDAKTIVNKIRAFNPSPVAFTQRNGEKIKIYQAEVVSANENIAAGEVVLQSSKEGLVVKCGKDAIKILKLQAPGGKVLDYKNYLNGRKFWKQVF